MAEKDKRSRALLRNLRKQARKGTLSSRERKTLLDQESKFRKARRGTAKGVGLGLAAGAAGLLSSPAAQRALGAAADRFKSSKADRKASRAEEEKAKAFNELQESATPTADADQAVAERVMQRGEDFNAIPEGPETVDFSDPKAMGATRASSRDNDEDFANAAFDRSQRILAGEELTGDPLMDLGVEPIEMDDDPLSLALRQARSDRRDREAGVASGRQIAFDAAFPAGMPQASQGGPRAVEGREMTDPNRPVMTRQGMTLGDMIAIGGRGGRLGSLFGDLERNPGPVNIPEGVNLLDGVEVQAQGGRVSQADKLRKMIAKKYGIR